MRWSRGLVGTVAVACAVVVVGSTASATEGTARETAQPPAGQSSETGDEEGIGTWAVPEDERDAVLGADWEDSADLAWTVTGDATGLHVLVAGEADGYAWRTVASLAVPGVGADRWIGNACLTGSGQRLAVVYAPRHFVNDLDLAGRGGRVAVVDLVSGGVTDVDVTASLAYFNPGCGDGETVALTQEGPGESLRTRVVQVDAATGAVTATTELSGQVTSAVPDPGTGAGALLAARGRDVVSVSADGATDLVATAVGVPSRLLRDADGGVVFLDTGSEGSTVRQVVGDDAIVVAQGPVGLIDIDRVPPQRAGETGGRSGEVAVLGGDAEVRDGAPGWVRHWAVDADSRVSSTGEVVVARTVSAADVPATVDTGEVPLDELEREVLDQGDEDPGTPDAVGVEIVSRDSGEAVAMLAQPGADPTAETSGSGPAATPEIDPDTGGAAGQSTADSVVGGSARACAVPRNDPELQVYQPTARQVEWAADQAVQENLVLLRHTDWRGSGLPSWRPQSMFPHVDLAGGGRMPATVLLGVLAQESNLKQASWHAVPGVTGNPLVGNYYGVDYYDGDPSDDWAIRWDHADCGYGVSQVTDGMRLPASGSPTDEQVAVAVDYATNIARGQQILAEKWNQTREVGMVVNDGDIRRPENWFFALWAYNAGFREEGADPTGAWGLIWGGNPANPRYDANRTPFMDHVIGGGARDAAAPYRWPYAERVLGWTAYSQAVPSFTWDDDGTPRTTSRSFNSAWWLAAEPEDGLPYSDRAGLSYGEANRLHVKPPSFTFCDPSNDCAPLAVNKQYCEAHVTLPDGTQESRCWWHESATWKERCYETCGRDSVRFNTTYGEPGDGIAYPPNCSVSGLPGEPRSALPSGRPLYVVDDVPDSVVPVRDGCPPGDSSGSFSFALSPGAEIDVHQVGAGYRGHFWFTHMRHWTSDPTATPRVTGTWRLDRSLAGQWVRVLVHMPDHGAYTQNARYVIDPGDGDLVTRSALQQTGSNAWVSLGVVEMAGSPTVTLTNRAGEPENDGDVNIAFDAVAFDVLPEKPQHIVVALGDSYSSGEGAGNYYPETNEGGSRVNPEPMPGEDTPNNACHRSEDAWHRLTVMPGTSSTIGNRADAWDPSLDFAFLACSGATTRNVLSASEDAVTAAGDAVVPQYAMSTQLDAGYLDENTTLVALSIGGNDAGFADIVRQCAGIFDGGCIDALDSEVRRRLAEEAEPSVAQTLRAIRREAPNARIVLMGYPRLWEPHIHPVDPPDPLSSYTCSIDWWPSVLQTPSGEEMAWMDELAVLLNDRLGEVVESLGDGRVSFASPLSEFQGHGVCQSGAALNGVAITPSEGEPESFPPVYAESLHPNQFGQTLYSNVYNAHLVGIRP